MHYQLLKEKRLEKGLSQAAMAEQLEITRQAYAKWENGKGEPSTAKMLQLSEMLEVPLDDLVQKNLDKEYNYSKSRAINLHKRSVHIKRTIIGICLSPIAVLCIVLAISRIQRQIKSDKCFDQTVGYINYLGGDFEEFCTFYSVDGVGYIDGSNRIIAYDKNGKVSSHQIGDSYHVEYQEYGKYKEKMSFKSKDGYMFFNISDYQEGGIPLGYTQICIYIHNKE